MHAYVVFTGSETMLILTSCPSVTDQLLVRKFLDKGITKFIAHELPIKDVQSRNGVPFEMLAADLRRKREVRVLDYNGSRIFNNFSLKDLGEPVRYEQH